jgi:hypothetical protein
VESVAVGCSCFSEGVVRRNLLFGVASGSARVVPNAWAAACACGSAAETLLIVGRCHARLFCLLGVLQMACMADGIGVRMPEQHPPISMVAYPSMTHS